MVIIDFVRHFNSIGIAYVFDWEDDAEDFFNSNPNDRACIICYGGYYNAVWYPREE